MRPPPRGCASCRSWPRARPPRRRPAGVRARRPPGEQGVEPQASGVPAVLPPAPTARRGRPRDMGDDPAVEIIAAAAETLRVPAAVDLAAIVVGALTGGLLAAREGFAASGVLLLAFTGGAGQVGRRAW